MKKGIVAMIPFFISLVLGLSHSKRHFARDLCFSMTQGFILPRLSQTAQTYLQGLNPKHFTTRGKI